MEQQQLKRTLSESVIRELFTVDLENGRLFWLKPSKYHARKIGVEAGQPIEGENGKFYWVIQINGHYYKRSHLIFCLVHGRFPFPQADHKNGNSLDDRPDNLREATATQNAWNHKHRRRRIDLPMGVRSYPSGRFAARIGFHGKQIYIGNFPTVDEAQLAYAAKRKELYGEFA